MSNEQGGQIATRTWRVSKNNPYGTASIYEDGVDAAVNVANVFRTGTPDGDANLAVILHARELRAALVEVVKCADGGPRNIREVVEDARAVIAKTGGAA